MISDEIPLQPLDTLPSLPHGAIANDNARAPPAASDPNILAIARAIGRQIAREDLERRIAENDNDPETPT